MLFKIILITILTFDVSSLKCIFEAKSTHASLNIHGRDECENDDEYCVKIEHEGGIAKGCSITLGKISGRAVPKDVVCDGEGCGKMENAKGNFCCCKGEVCNDAAGVEVLMGVLTLGFGRILLNV